MPEEIRTVDHFIATIANKTGSGASALGALRDFGANLIAFWGYPQGASRAIIEIIPEDGASFVAAAKKTKLKIGKKQTAIYIQGEDRPGAVAGVLEKLAAAKINVNACHAVAAGEGRYGCVIFGVGAAATRKAAQVLGAASGQQAQRAAAAR